MGTWQLELSYSHLSIFLSCQRPTVISPSFLLILPPNGQWPQLKFSLSQNPNSSSHILHHFRTNYRRRWDSNAETFRSQNFNFQYDDDEDDDDTDTSSDADQWFEVLEEFIDDVWIFKVFKSFGWMLPAIIFSLLLATGPKAFLMALALPLGQSVLTFAFQKVWGRTQNNPKRKAKAKRKPRRRTVRNVELEEEEEESQRTKKGKMGYQSWVGGNNVPGDKGSQDEPNFGGWEELDRRTKFNTGSERKSARTKFKSKLSRGERRSDMPLLLRLLIAVFPFLGSWTKML